MPLHITYLLLARDYLLEGDRGLAYTCLRRALSEANHLRNGELKGRILAAMAYCRRIAC